MWTEAFAFTARADGLPVCLICSEKISNNKKVTLKELNCTRLTDERERLK